MCIFTCCEPFMKYSEIRLINYNSKVWVTPWLRILGLKISPFTTAPKILRSKSSTPLKIPLPYKFVVKKFEIFFFFPGLGWVRTVCEWGSWASRTVNWSRRCSKTSGKTQSSPTQRSKSGTKGSSRTVPVDTLASRSSKRFMETSSRTAMHPR